MPLQRFPADVIALKLAISIAIGLLVGLEREWSNKDVGVRTFALVSLMGMAASLIGLPFAIIGFVAVIAIVAIINTRSILVNRSLEITTSAAMLVIYALGVLVGAGHLFTPVASAILMTMLLAWKMELQRFAGGLKPEEIRSAVLLCLIGFVIYPVLPNRFIDPWQLINPRKVWLIVIVVAGIGFFNYVLLRIYSTRGLYWSALLGGLVNSTAAIAEFSHLLATSEMAGMAVSVNLLTVLAMFVRNLVLLAIFAPATLTAAVFPVAAMAVFATLILWRSRGRYQPPDGGIKLSSPLSLTRIVEFGGLFLLIEILATISNRFFGSAGFLAITTVGGFASSASSTVAAADLAAGGHISPLAAGVGTVLASMASSAVNVPIVAKQIGDRKIGARVTLLTVAQLLIGIAALLILYYVHLRRGI